MSVNKIKKLREITFLGVLDCRDALNKSEGDFDKALKFLQKKSKDLIHKKKDRVTSSGLVESYIHFGGNLGSLVEINCETDFVAKTDKFKQFVKDIAMHVAAIGPAYLKREDIPKEELDDIDDLGAFAKANCLMEQSFVKDGSKTITDYLK